MIFFNVLQPCGSAAQQFISHTVQNHQQDWNDVREGTIMLITLPEDNTGKTVLTVRSLKEGRGWGECVEQPPSLDSRGQEETDHRATKPGLIVKTVAFEVLIFVSSFLTK